MRTIYTHVIVIDLWGNSPGQLWRCLCRVITENKP